MSYKAYSTEVSTDPAAYHSACTSAEAERIAPYLAEIIEEEFPGIRVSLTDTGGPVRGPDAEICEEIRAWIETNWVLAAEGCA